MKQVNIILIYTDFLIAVAGNSIKCKHGENKHGGAKVREHWYMHGKGH